MTPIRPRRASSTVAPAPTAPRPVRHRGVRHLVVALVVTVVAGLIAVAPAGAQPPGEGPPANVPIPYTSLDNQPPAVRDLLRARGCAGNSCAGKDLSGLDISAGSFSGWNFSDAVLDRTRFAPTTNRPVSLVGTNFAGAKMDGTILVAGQGLTRLGPNLRYANLDRVAMANTMMVSAKLEDASMRGAQFEHVDFDSADVRRLDASPWVPAVGGGQAPTTFRECYFYQVANWHGADFSNTVFENREVPLRLTVGAGLRQSSMNGNYAQRADLGVRGLTFAGADFSGVTVEENASQLTFTGASAGDRVDLDGVKLPDVAADLTLVNVRMDGVDLRGKSFPRLVAFGVDIKDSDLTGVRIDQAQLTGVKLEGSNLARASLRDANLQDVQMSGVDLRGAALDGARIVSSTLENVDAEGATALGARMNRTTVSSDAREGAQAPSTMRALASGGMKECSPGCQFSGSVLRGADLSGWRLVLANINNADLTGASFAGATLDLASFGTVTGEGVNFRGARMVSASFGEARLDGADFRDANLSGAKFEASYGVPAKIGAPSEDQRGACRNCDFRGAEVGGLKMTGVDLFGSDFRDVRVPAEARLLRVQQAPELSRVSMTLARLPQSMDRWSITDSDLGTAYLPERASARGADLSGSAFDGQTFTNVDLAGATLGKTSRNDATTFRGATFRGTTSLDGATVGDVDLTGAGFGSSLGVFGRLVRWVGSLFGANWWESEASGRLSFGSATVTGRVQMPTNPWRVSIRDARFEPGSVLDFGPGREALARNYLAEQARWWNSTLANAEVRAGDVLVEVGVPIEAAGGVGGSSEDERVIRAGSNEDVHSDDSGDSDDEGHGGGGQGKFGQPEEEKEDEGGGGPAPLKQTPGSDGQQQGDENATAPTEQRDGRGDHEGEDFDFPPYQSDDGSAHTIIIDPYDDDDRKILDDRESTLGRRVTTGTQQLAGPGTEVDTATQGSQTMEEPMKGVSMKEPMKEIAISRPVSSSGGGQVPAEPTKAAIKVVNKAGGSGALPAPTSDVNAGGGQDQGSSNIESVPAVGQQNSGGINSVSSNAANNDLPTGGSEQVGGTTGSNPGFDPFPSNFPDSNKEPESDGEG